MASLQCLLDNPQQREVFINAVVSGSKHRSEVVLNDGIVSPEESQALICQEPMPFAEYVFSLEEISSVTGEGAIDTQRLEELLRQEPMAFANYDFFPDR